MNRFFESHAHYDDKAFDADRDELLSILPQSVGIVVNAGSSVSSSRKGAELAERYPYIYSAAGVHPHDAKELTDAGMAELSALCKREKTVAVGEIGLDYHYDNSPRDVQRYWFKEQLLLSLKESLPVIIHSREAERDTFDIISETDVRRGVIHCFSGSRELAEQYVKLGFYIGIGGVVTYKNAKRIIEAAEKIPLERILIETDCPYLSPEPERGKRNDSLKLKYIAGKIAEIKGISADKAAEATFENGLRLFEKCRTS